MNPELRELYLQDFLEEAFENIDIVATMLSGLTAEALDQSAIDQLFRCIHNVKGMSGTIGATDITSASHTAEETLSVCRERGAMTVGERTDLLASVDGLADLLDQLAADDGSDRGPAPQSEDAVVHEPSEGIDEPSRVPVDVDKLDALLDITTELVVARGLLEKQAGDAANRELLVSASHIRKLTSDLQWLVTELRMVSTKNLLTRMARMARDVARERGKSVEVKVEGLDSALDRSLINGLGEPLSHLVRNAVDHGIESASERAEAGKTEPATIWISAQRRAGRFVVSVADNGRGISADDVARTAIATGAVSERHVAELSEQERIELVFQAGVSTAAEVDHLSGRGVGLDAVHCAVATMGGRISLATQTGAGTTFSVSLPLSLAIAKVLLTRIGPSIWGVPLDNIVETIIVDPMRVVAVGERSMMEVRGALALVVDGRRVLDDGGVRVAVEQPAPALILNCSRGQIVLVVDELLTTEEVVVKPTPTSMGQSLAVGATTILRDGSVGLLLDTEGLGAMLDQPTINAIEALQ